MATTSNGNSNLVLHLEKIAYGACGAAALVVLLVPLFSGKGVKNLEAQILANMDAVKERERERPEIPTVQPLREDLEKQWKIPTLPQSYPEWTTERIPSVIKWTQQPPVVPVEHNPASVVRIEYHRHSERLQPYLRVVGKFGDLQHGVFRDVKLLRRKGEEGDFVELRDFGSSQALLSQAIEYDDFDVEPGMVYAYRIRTEAAEAPDASENIELRAENIFKESEPCVIAQPVPHDFAINIIVANAFDPVKGKAGHFIGDITIANFADESGKPEKLSTTTFEVGFEFGPMRGGRKVFSILLCEDGVVTIRDQRNLSVKHVIKRSEPQRPVELPPPFECGAPPPPAGEQPGAEAPPAPPAGQPEPAAGPPPGEEKKEAPKKAGDPAKAKDKDKDKDKAKDKDKKKKPSGGPFN